MISLTDLDFLVGQQDWNGFRNPLIGTVGVNLAYCSTVKIQYAH